MLLRAPTRIWLTSARSTQLYQMLTSGPITTSPMIRHPGAMHALGSISGVLPFTLMIEMSLRGIHGLRYHNYTIAKAEQKQSRRSSVRNPAEIQAHPNLLFPKPQR